MWRRSSCYYDKCSSLHSNIDWDNIALVTAAATTEATHIMKRKDISKCKRRARQPHIERRKRFGGTRHISLLVRTECEDSSSAELSVYHYHTTVASLFTNKICQDLITHDI
jgi:hypothetical protein